MATEGSPAATREAMVVINLRSRSGQDIAQSAQKELERQGVRVRGSRLARSGPELLTAVRGAIESGVGTLVIGGGDGTISTVVDLLANRPHLTLGLLPVGTGNEVARVLGIPLGLTGACRVIARGRATTIDLAEARGNYFVHTALIGYPAHANHIIPPWLKRRLGKAAYLYAFLASIFGARPFHATVTAGSSRWEVDTKLVIVGNGRFHTPCRILLPPSDWGGESLVVYAPRDTRWSTALKLVVGLWITRRPQRELLLSAAAEDVTVTAEPPQPIDLDGEMARPTPAGFRLARAALRMLVP